MSQTAQNQEAIVSIPTPKVGDIWYRYEDKRYSVTIDAEREEYGVKTVVELREYIVRKVTPKGVWVSSHPIVTPRFCLHAAHKRFACSTLELAKESYIARKKKQIAIHDGIAKAAMRCIDTVVGEVSMFQRYEFQYHKAVKGKS